MVRPVVTYGFANIDDFARFLKLFGDFLTKTERKLAEIGGFWVLFDHPHFQAKKGVEKSGGKIRRFSKKLPQRSQGFGDLLIAIYHVLFSV